jgi:hypothetical protein
MPLAIGALGQSQDEQVSLLQTRAKIMEEGDRVWSNVTRDEATGKMAEDELLVANISGLDAERFWSNVTQEGATAVSGCNWVQTGASGSAQEPHCHYSNYKPVCSPANSGRYYFGNPWDVMGGDAKTLATCNGGWYYHGAKPTDRKFTCDCPKPPPPLPAGAVCDWTTTYTSGSFPEPHCHYANFHPSCDANSRGKYYYGNPWDVGGGNAQELSACNGGWFSHGAKPYHKRSHAIVQCLRLRHRPQHPLLHLLHRRIAIGFKVAPREVPHNPTATMRTTNQYAMKTAVASTTMETLGM